MLLLLIAFLLLSTVRGKPLTGIFKKFESLNFNSGADRDIKSPSFGWLATFTWKIDGSTVEPGDTFELNAPCSLFLFTSPLAIKVSKTTVATCVSDRYLSDDGYPGTNLKCTITSSVAKGVVYNGKISIQTTFRVGETGIPDALACASKFSNGVNSVVKKVTFNDGLNDLTATVDFEGGALYGDDPEKIALGKVYERNYVLAGQCANGYTSGTLGVESSAGSLDCASIYQAITTKLNAWYYPLNTKESNYKIVCSKKSFEIQYTNIPKGSRPLVYFGTNLVDVKDALTYKNVYKCKGSNEVVDNSVTTTTWDKPTTSTTTLPFTSGGTKTIVVQVPTPSSPVVTITTTWDKPTTSTTTLPFTSGGTKTIVVQVPTPSSPVVTITTTWDKPNTETTTLPFTSGGTKTIVVQVPTPSEPVVTVTTTWDKPTTETTTLPFTSGGTKTIVVQVPPTSPPVVTITTTWDKPNTETTTLPFTSGGTKAILVLLPSIEFPSKYWNSTTSQRLSIGTVSTSAEFPTPTDKVKQSTITTTAYKCDICTKGTNGSNPDHNENTKPDNHQNTKPDNHQNTKPDNHQNTKPDSDQNTTPDNNQNTKPDNSNTKSDKGPSDGFSTSSKITPIYTISTIENFASSKSVNSIFLGIFTTLTYILF